MYQKGIPYLDVTNKSIEELTQPCYIKHIWIREYININSILNFTLLRG